MKTMSCKQLGGACDLQFHADTFHEIAELSRTHGMVMYQSGDEDHLRAMNDMSELMKNPAAMKDWMDSKKKEFDALPDD